MEAGDCPMSSCAAPAGSPCRTTKGRVAAQYHAARVRAVPRLAKALSVAVPALRRPGSAWAELPRPSATAAGPAGHVRIGYARTSTTRQVLDTQLLALHAEGITRIYAEKISTRAGKRPELGKAMAAAQEFRRSGMTVTIVADEHRRIGRGLELAQLAEQLRASDVGLEFLKGPLRGAHDPTGVVLTVLAVVSGLEREYIREKTLEGHEVARAKGKVIGGTTVTDPAMLADAVRYRKQGLSLRQTAAKLVITTGPKTGKHPAPSTVLRMLREHDEAESQDG